MEVSDQNHVLATLNTEERDFYTLWTGGYVEPRASRKCRRIECRSCRESNPGDPKHMKGK